MAAQKKNFTYLSQKKGDLIGSIQEHIGWVDITDVDKGTTDNWEPI